jgi:hypothetical protein
MPTANLQVFKDREEITEVHFIVSESLVKGYVGQLRIKTLRTLGDGSADEENEYKYGRTTDGAERSLITPPGHRLLCFTGRCLKRALLIA